MTITPDPDKTALRDKVLSLLRTGIPIAWGWVLMFLLARVPTVHSLVDNASVYTVIEGAVTLAWYTLWRFTEQHIPPWLTRLLLGANASPTYRTTLRRSAA
jgi:hypothetical protein